MFDTMVTGTVTEGQHLKGIIVENQSGRSVYTAKMFVDTTGDATILAKAGIPTAIRGNYHSYMGTIVSLDSCRKALETRDIANASAHFSGGTASLFGARHPEDMPLYDATSSSDVNRYVIQNQLEMLGKLKDTPRTSRDIVALPGMPQFRTCRRLEGSYTLRESDVFHHFSNSIGAICDFAKRDLLYEIPYTCLIRSGWDNLITAGRSASADGYAWDVVRVIPPAIITGQAAGVACAQAIASGKAIDQVDVSALQTELAQQNVLIHFDDADIPATVEGKVEAMDE